MRTLGLNLGHDAGVASVDASGVHVAELEKALGLRHACGGTPGARDAVRKTIASLVPATGRCSAIGIADFASPLADYADGATGATVNSPAWSAGRPSDRPVTALLPSGLDTLGDALEGVPAFLVRHHWAHANLAYRTAQTERAVVLVLDGTGNFSECGLIAIGTGDRLEKAAILSNVTGPRFGLPYESFARSVFGSQFHTGKVLGLGAFGTGDALAVEVLRALIAPQRLRRANPRLFDPLPDDLLSEARIRVGGRWLRYDAVGGGFVEHLLTSGREVERWLARGFPEEIEVGGRRIPIPFDPEDAGCRNAAASLQTAFETDLLRLVDGLAGAHPKGFDLCYAGGCALNILANTRLATETPFERVFIPSCCDDSGIALGAALAVAPRAAKRSLRRAEVDLAYAGPAFGEGLDPGSTASGSALEFPSVDDLIGWAAAALREGCVLGWVEGRCETGPRALGHRSMLGSPLISGMRRRMSEDIKGREAFRPVAAACTVERARAFFDGPPMPTPTMLFSWHVRPAWRKRLSEAVHVDGSVRLQTVASPEAPTFHALLSAFAGEAGVPILLNTSLNEGGRPLANAGEAVATILATTPIDAIVLVDRRRVLRRAGPACGAAAVRPRVDASAGGPPP